MTEEQRLRNLSYATYDLVKLLFELNISAAYDLMWNHGRRRSYARRQM